jgi:peptide/nickel transport system permease protein
MLAFLLRRILQALVVVLCVSVLVFLMTYYGGGDPVYAMLPPQATREQIAAMRHAMGLDQPVAVQYGLYLAGLLHGNLGNSWNQGRPVAEIILERFPATLELATVGLVFSILLGIPSGLYAALEPRSWVTRAARGTSILAISIPPFWLGIMLILVFSVGLRWLPSSGRGAVFQLSGVRLGFLTRDGLLHLVLPGLTLAVFNSALIMRLQRVTMLEELTKEYVKYARAKGLPRSRVIFGHAFRNTLVPMLTFVSLIFGQSIAFSVITETIFAWPGTGKLLIDAIGLNDRPVVVGYLMFVSVLFSVVNLLTDLGYGVIDPRIRVK